MKHIAFDNKFSTAIFIKEGALNEAAIKECYIDKCGLDNEGLVAFDLSYGGKKKPTAALRKEYLNKLMHSISSLGILHILCCDTEYFKTLTGKQNVNGALGYAFPCKLQGYEHINVFFSYNHQALFYKPELLEKIQLSVTKLSEHKDGTYVEPGTGIIHSESYPSSLEAIRNTLAQLHQYDKLTCDFECFSLKHYTSGIGSVGFAWDEHNGIAFSCDYNPLAEPVNVLTAAGRKTPKWYHGEQIHNTAVRALLKEFFETYKGTLIWHNVSYDAYIAVYQLWMGNLLDQAGMLTGMGIMLKRFECTKLITYLATNTCSGNKLTLKEQAHEFAGSWAQEDIKDIRLIPEPELLRYNLVDCLSTWYTYNKNYPVMVKDEQEDIYRNLFKPCVTDIIQMQLTGMCVDRAKVLEAEAELLAIKQKALDNILKLPITQQFIKDNIDKEVADRNAAYKQKVIDSSEAEFKFNPNSNPQMQTFLYEYLGLPIIDLTKTKQPAVGSKTLEKLIGSIVDKDGDKLLVLNSLVDFIKVGKLLSAFIPSLKEAPLAPDGYHYVFGSFNLGGTVSGRLSSSNPNMQNMPSGSTYAWIIKKCFIAPTGYIFVGADSASLEDRIDALLTKDPNKLLVYTDGYDGHCLRAYAYFGKHMPDITSDKESVNSIKSLYPQYRQDSKAPTFALTYQGTWRTLMNNCGFDESLAKSIEENYHTMYEASDKWKAAKIKQASIDGYTTVAFGLRLRTPLLAQVILGNNKTPFEAEAEGRTVGNAFGQSYGLMNSRTCNEINSKIRASKYRLDIRPCAQIHDAGYWLCKDDLSTLKFLNDAVGKAFSWQELPEIAHDKVHLSGELDVFYPHWGMPITLKNNLSENEIRNVLMAENKARKDKL